MWKILLDKLFQFLELSCYVVFLENIKAVISRALKKKKEVGKKRHISEEVKLVLMNINVSLEKS